MVRGTTASRCCGLWTPAEPLCSRSSAERAASGNGGGALYRKLCARQPLANYLRKCRAGGSFVRMHFYLLPSFNFCLLNLFIYFVLGYHIRW